MNKEKTIKFLWISMWATLLLMVVLKLTFNYYYPIVIENSKLLEISKYIDERNWLDNLLAYPFYIFNCIFVCLCAIKEKWFTKKWHLILVILTYTILYPIKLYTKFVGTILIFILYFLIPLLITKNKKRWIIIMFALDNVFQLLSNFTRGNNMINTNTFIIRNCMLIDYYLMFMIYYIGGNYMGNFTLLPWFTKKETVINAKIEKLQKKIKKLEEQKECLKRR
jgi:hypothetical protein